MNRILEIETRLSAIKGEIDAADTAKLAELETEITALKEERISLTEQAEKRKSLLNGITAGEIPATIIEPIKEERKIMDFENMTKEQLTANPEFRSAYLKNLQGKPLNETEQRALSTAAGSAGAAVPTTLVNGIIDKLVQTSALFGKISVTNIPGNVTFAVANAKNDAAWKVEGADGTPADDTVASVSLAGYELIKLVEISAAARAMTIDAFEQYVIAEISRKMAIALENAILNGTGTGQPKGVLAETLTGVTFTKAAMAYKDITKIMAALPTMYHPGAIFAMPRALFFNEVLGMQDTGGKPIVVADAQSPAKFNLLGYPVVIDDYMPVDTILFGDFSFYKMNFSKDIAIEADGSVGFKSGKITYRGLAVVDGKTALTEAFVKATRSAT